MDWSVALHVDKVLLDGNGSSLGLEIAPGKTFAMPAIRVVL